MGRFSMVRERGLEPPRPKALAPKACEMAHKKCLCVLCAISHFTPVITPHNGLKKPKSRLEEQPSYRLVLTRVDM